METIIKKNRNMYIVYPNHVHHRIKAEYARETVDEKYILKYIDYDRDGASFVTELLYLDGEWSKCPFDINNDSEFEYKEFDQELSDSIIEQLPKYMYFRMLVNGKKKGDIFIPQKLEFDSDLQLMGTGAKIIQSNNNTYYMILYTNGGENIVSKKSSLGTYDLDFKFPTYSLKGVSSHRLREMRQEDDVNYNIDYKELEYFNDDLPDDVRKIVSGFLKNDTKDNFDVTKLPMINVVSQEGKEYNIWFVSCSDDVLFDQSYKADKIYVDYDMKISSFYDKDLERALHCEIPVTFVHSNGLLKTNGVSHSVNYRKVA